VGRILPSSGSKGHLYIMVLPSFISLDKYLIFRLTHLSPLEFSIWPFSDGSRWKHFLLKPTSIFLSHLTIISSIYLLIPEGLESVIDSSLFINFYNLSITKPCKFYHLNVL
jgi:hypothetical protein